jgi:hypothetical protein
MVRRGEDQSRIAAQFVLDKQDFGTESEHVSSKVRTELIKKGDYEEVHGGPSYKGWDAIYVEDSPGFFLLGYSTTRRVEAEEHFSPASLQRSRRLRYQRVSGLFEDQIALAPLGSWLPRVMDQQPRRAKEIIALMNRLLTSEPATGEEQIYFSGESYRGEVMFQINEIPVPYSALSDGYRKYVAWTGDLLYHLNLSCPEYLALTAMNGIVMLDEVDLHLHPEWQRHVIGTIAKTFPDLQFVFTTHSPIVAGTVHAENILLMEPDDDGAARVRRTREPIFGKNADQVLLSSYFGLNTTRAPGFARELDNISKRAYQGDPKAAVEYLEKLTATGGSLAEGVASA